MKAKILVTATMLALVLPALAQQERRGGRGPGGGIDRDQDRPRAQRQMGPVERGRGFGPPRLETMADRIAASLDLSEQQRAQYDEIVARYSSMFADQRATREQMRELAMAYREARRAGDTERADEIAAQIREQGGARRPVLDGFMNEVEGILDADQVLRLAEIRENMGRAAPRERARDMRRVLRELPDELEMTEEQRAAYEQIMADERARMGGMRESWQELRPLMRELREARQAGDEARVAELEAEIEAKRPQRPSLDALFDKVAEILTAEQQAQLEQIRSQTGQRRGLRQPRLDLQVVIQSAQRLNVQGEQRRQLRVVLQEAMRMERRERDPDARARVAESVRQEVVALLTPEQVTEFDELIAARSGDGRRARGPDGRQRGERGQRGRGPGQPGEGRGPGQQRGPGGPVESGAVEEDLF